MYEGYSLTTRPNAVVFEDPAGALNMSEKAWNDLVQKQAQEFKDKAVREQKERFAKNRAIMEEQKKQIEEKQRLRSQDKIKDREFFHEVGCQSSDVYYINEDKRIAAQNKLKGNAAVLAENLRARQNQKKAQKLNTMQANNIAREEAIKQLENEKH